MPDNAPVRQTQVPSTTANAPVADAPVKDKAQLPKLPAAEPPSRDAMLLPLLVFAVIAGLFGYALMRPGDPTKIPSALLGRSAPPMALPGIDGLVAGGKPVPGISATDFGRGTPVLVNFWASWCLPCVDEHPLLVALNKRTGVTILGVDHKDQSANARRFLARHGNPFAAVGADDGRAGIEWGVYGMPETFVVDGRGIVVFKHVGPLSPEAIETQLLPALEKAKAMSGPAK